MTVNELIISNIDLANKIAFIKRKSLPKCVSFDEIQSAAFAGLTIAANRYDPEKGKFSTYAYFKICWEVKDYLRSLFWNGRGRFAKVDSCNDDFAKTETDNFDEFFDDFTKNLSAIGKKIVWLYYVEKLTLKEIAVEIKLSVTRVHQLLKNSLGLLRNGRENS